jgi:hypothetical protein
MKTNHKCRQGSPLKYCGNSTEKLKNSVHYRFTGKDEKKKEITLEEQGKKMVGSLSSPAP